MGWIYIYDSKYYTGIHSKYKIDLLTLESIQVIVNYIVF